MSLLIKALATAEQEKQAELKKRQTDEALLQGAPDVSLDLTLEPLSNDAAMASPEPAQDHTLDLSASHYDDGLTLAEEAGLVTAKVATKAPTKSRSSASPSASSLSADSLDADSAQASIKAKTEAFNAAAAASLASAKSQTASAPKNTPQQAAAASVFVANQPVRRQPASRLALLALGCAGALMIWLGLQGYQYFNTLKAPEVVVIKPSVPLEPAQESAAALNVVEPAPLAGAETQVAATPVEADSSNQSQQVSEITPPAASKPEAKPTEPAEVQSSDSVLVADEGVAKKSATRGAKKAKAVVLDDDGEPVVAKSNARAQRQSVSVQSKTPAATVDPTLLAAYQAFSTGDYAVAQKQYRQVLQRDVRNVDALLGMAAIAQRQNREADAAGWYQKVLEVEPRNSFAQSAMATLQMNAHLSDNQAEGVKLGRTDMVGTESSIKNMLAQQPESANLHAALGNVYANQDHWASAQEAYFNASRYAPKNADYAFNLAISLDQLGKSGLALAQYQRALDLLNSSGASSPDRSQLEARIKALQAAN